ncbi:MAG: hypothetical protein JKP90_05355 [Desulfofustis sp. PB-SRB1]|jgi:hypothetical protein|nr:hypothetical protein [Desulfofustis sp. PB-SRB1]
MASASSRDGGLKEAGAQVIQELHHYVLGWWGYFRLTEAKSFLKGLKI